MSEPKLISPLLDEYIMGDPISDHHGVRCCPAIKKETDEKYIVKILSIPASSAQMDALLLTGAFPSPEAALAYYRELSDSAVKEAELLQRLSKLEGFVAFDGWQIEAMEDGKGFDIYFIGTYRPTLERHMARNPMTHQSAVNLGLDMCAALSVARQSGYLYADLKPENIVITGHGEYRIGDLGFIPLDSLKYASLPDKYRSPYTAPEITDAYSALNTTMDIYAAGLILYQAYNSGMLPAAEEDGQLLPPAYADYEMAEIILKACAAAPEDRWQTPVEMGQALISYLQRNTVTDTPIVPQPVADEPEFEEEPETDADIDSDVLTEDSELLAEGEEAEVPEAEASLLTEDEQLTFLSSDETEPSEEIASELADTAVTDEVGEMLDQADELIAHEVPESVVQPEPIDVPIPPRITLEDEQEAPEEETQQETAEAPSEEEEAAENMPADEAAEEESEEIAAEETPSKPSRFKKRIITIVAAVLGLWLLILGGIAYYEFGYTKTINDMTLVGSEDRLTVILDTNIDNELLTVVCSNTYGSTIRVPVENNTAQLFGLTPDTQYKITVEISGFHRLVGTTTDTYNTDPRAEIVSFTAVTGTLDGSVILNFVVHGYDDSNWNVFYSAPGEAEKSVTFPGHMVTITGLTVGKEYTFRVEPVSTEYVTGNNIIIHKASKLIYAENLTILGFRGDTLNAKWDAPAGAAVTGWTVRCYNEFGFDTTVTVTEPAVSIPGLDPTAKYTLDICASGMSQGTQTYISANSITITQVQVDDTAADQLNITWEFTGEAPEGGWLVLYSINGSEAQVIPCESNSCILSALIPNSQYRIWIKSASGVSTFGEAATYDVPDYGSFDNYRVTADDMEFQMCNTPNKANWTRYDLKAADYTTTFAVGKRASFLIHLTAASVASSDSITTRFVIRNQNGSPIIVEDSIRTWTAMWRSGYCSLDIPAMPQTAGDYTVDIYFNNAYVTTQSFTIQ